MPRFKVHVTHTVTHGSEVEIEADNAYAAEELAPAVRTLSEQVRTEAVIAHAVRQVGEPWVYGTHGHDSRPDGYMETEDLLVFTRAFGNAFSKEDVSLLLKRVEDAVGSVVDHWNGEGSDSLSIRVASPFGKLNSAQVTALMAPRT